MTERRIAELTEKAANVRRFAEEAAKREDGTWGGSPESYWRGRLDGITETLDAMRAELAERYDGPERRRAREDEVTENLRRALAAEADAYDRLNDRYNDRGDVLAERERELAIMTEQADMLGAIASDLYNELADAEELASEARTAAWEDGETVYAELDGRALDVRSFTV